MVSVATVQRDEPAQATLSQTSKTPDVKHIISEFTVGETELRKSFDQYGYHRDLLIQTVKKGKVTGAYHRITQLSLGKDGKPEEKVLSFPRPSLTEVTVTPEDLECLSPNYHFTLGESNVDKYEFTYIGSDRTADRDFYVFDVRPKRVGAKELLFKGRIWVSGKDLRVIKIRGLCVTKTNQSFPVLEISRGMVDGVTCFHLTHLQMRSCILVLVPQFIYLSRSDIRITSNCTEEDWLAMRSDPSSHMAT